MLSHIGSTQDPFYPFAPPINRDGFSSSAGANKNTLECTAQTALKNVIHPDINKYYREHTGPDTLSQTDVVVLFQQAQEFRQFASDMQECLNKLQHEYAPMGKHSKANYETLINRLEFTAPAKGNTFFKNNLLHVYRFTCLHFKQILALLEYAKNNPEQFPPTALNDAKVILKNMEDEFTMCGPSVISAVESSLTELKNLLFQQSIQDEYRETKTRVVQQYLAEKIDEVFQDNPWLNDFHAHAVNTWLEKLSGRLQTSGMQIRDSNIDHTLYVSPLPYTIQADIERGAELAIAPLRIVETMALNALQKAVQLASAPADDNKPGQTTRAICEKLGNIPANAVFQETGPGNTQLKVHTDPTLMIAALREKLCGGYAEPGPEWPLSGRLTLPGTPKEILNVWGKYCWKECNVQGAAVRELLDTNDVARAIHFHNERKPQAQFTQLPALLNAIGIAPEWQTTNNAKFIKPTLSEIASLIEKARADKANH